LQHISGFSKLIVRDGSELLQLLLKVHTLLQIFILVRYKTCSPRKLIRSMADLGKTLVKLFVTEQYPITSAVSFCQSAGDFRVFNISA